MLSSVKVVGSTIVAEFLTSIVRLAIVQRCTSEKRLKRLAIVNRLALVHGLMIVIFDKLTIVLEYAASAVSKNLHSSRADGISRHLRRATIATSICDKQK